MKNSKIGSAVKIFKSSLLVLIVLSAFYSCSTNDNFEVVDLKCEYLENPLGIDVTTPRISWEINANKNDFKQKAYRVLAASNLKELNNNIGDLWDTDTVLSDQSIQIVYKGKELNSREKVFWKVKIWDQENKASSWSKTASWEMALLNESNWKAKWIGIKELQNAKVYQKNPTSYFRKEFTLKSKIQNGRAYISGLGYYELYINGKKVGDHVLSPNQTNYDRRQVKKFDDKRIGNMSTRVLYETYDISSYLNEGENVAAVILGNGWYFRSEREEYLPLSYDLPRFIAQIEIRNSDGTNQMIISDETWKESKGPLVENSIYYGEVYDARLEEPGWNKQGFDDSKWKQAKVVRAPEGKLCAQMSPPDRVVGTIQPVKITTPQKGIYKYDFGTMFSGWVKLKVKGKRGTKLKMTFFEDNGNTYEQTDTYILKGKGLEEWQPRFTWHAFRYVEVSGSPVPLMLDNLEGKVVHTDVKSAGTFESSNKLFNRILTDYKKTQLDNMHGGVPSDCPHRERRGYTGDGQISAQAAIYDFNMSAFYTKWLNDIADAQNKKTGYVPYTAPYQSGGGGTPWGSAYIIIPWYMYLYYGDVAVLEKHYEGMKHYAEYLKTQTDKEGLIIENNLGEWVPPAKTEIPPSFVSSAYYYYDLTLMSNIAKILNKDLDETSFTKLAKAVKRSFNKRYLNQDKFSYSIGWQGANVFPLAFDLVPEELTEKVFKNLVKNIETNAKGHFDTGMMGTPYVLEVLTKYGRPDLAYTVMNRRDYPSFGYNIERGATTLWETWTGKDSHSHPMFGSVCAWFYQGLGGINPDPQNPGFKHTIIKPNIVNELDFVNVSYHSVYGEIKSNWELKNGDLKLKVVVPPNITASVFIPGSDIKNVSSDNSDVVPAGVENNLIRYEIPSGEYTFISKNIGSLLRTPMLSIPVIDPPDSTLFSPDSVSINIRQYSKDAEIRYTLDGSKPDKNSKLFTKPFILHNSAVIKARVFREGMKPGFTKTNRIVFIDTLKNGINYKYYIGAWSRLPDFSKLKPTRTGRVYNISLNEFDNLDEKFAILFTGNIEFKSGGAYNFLLISNDGSKLFIDDKLVIDADGPHSFAGEPGTIDLTKGIHRIRIEYFQMGGGKGLELLYDGPGIEKQIIPADVLIIKHL